VTLGRHIAFAPGHFAPDTREGQSLLGHELAHVVQQAGGTPGPQFASPGQATQGHESQASAAAATALVGGMAGSLSRVVPAPQTDSGPMCVAGEPKSSTVAQPEPQVCRADPPMSHGPLMSSAPAALLPQAGTTAERTAAFKSMVLTTAVLRLRGNQSNLAQWSTLVMNTIPKQDLAATGLLQTGGSGAYFELQDIHDPQLRELRANQAEGRFRACTGCHLETRIRGSQAERQAIGGVEWATPNEQRRAAWGQQPQVPAFTPFDPARGFTPAGPGYHPAPGTAEGRLNRLFPDPSAVPAQLSRASVILAALGPDHYKVLPQDILDMLGTSTPDALRCRIDAAIAERSRGYGELTVRIQSGRMGQQGALGPRRGHHRRGPLRGRPAADPLPADLGAGTRYRGSAGHRPRPLRSCDRARDDRDRPVLPARHRRRRRHRPTAPGGRRHDGPWRLPRRRTRPAGHRQRRRPAVICEPGRRCSAAGT
jgi:hypothetical protein